MTTTYNCNKCNKTFNQKIDYTRHINNKKPCISFKEIENMITNSDNTHKLFNSCLNIVRDNENLIGERAMTVINYFLILRLLEPNIINGIIDIDNYNYDLSEMNISTDKLDEHKKKLLHIARFSNLAKEKEEDIPQLIEYLWYFILSQHEYTKVFYDKNNIIKLKNQSSYRKIINTLMDFDFENADYDIHGVAYEKVITDIFNGKTLGQFFTDRKITEFMTELIKPKLFADGKTETIFDPAMGTGGFLVSAIKYIKKQSCLHNIPLDWNYIKNYSIGGQDAITETYQFALANMFISTGHSFTTLTNGDSIRKTITNKYDIILANPPFGIKGLEYDEIAHPLKNEYLPIKTKSAVPLFLQAIIYMLNINGRCAVVLPDGQDLFSKTNTSLISIREFLLKTCDLHEIIYLPSGIFEHTSIKTCIFFFTKKKDGKDVIKINSKISKSTNKELSRSYNFPEQHQTQLIKFYEYNPDRKTKTELAEVSIEDIAKNKYSLNYTEYLKDDNNEIIYENDIEVKTLGEVCDFLNGYAFKSNQYQGDDDDNSIGILSIKTIQDGYISKDKITNYIPYNSKYFKFEINNNDILIALTGATIGKIGIYTLPYKSYLNQRVAKLICKENVVPKYVYYWYINNNIDKLINTMAIGQAQPNISINELSTIEIPIPSLEKQQEIVQYLDFIYEKSIKTSNEKINQLKELNKMYIDTFTKYGKNEIKTLGDIISDTKTGKDITSENRIKGNYPFYGANGIIDYIHEYLFDGTYLLTARTGSLGSLHITNGKFWCTGDVHRLSFDNENTLLYIYYYLQTIDFQKFRTGAAHPKLSGSNLKSIQIHVPSLEKQKEIVKYCEHNDNLIKQLETEIENNKKQAKEFLDMILNISTNDISITHSIDDEKSLDEQIEEHKSNTSSIQQSTDTTSNHSTKSTRSIGLLPDTILKDMCKERNIKGMSNKKKPILAKTLLDYHNNLNNQASSSYKPLLDNELNEINKIIEHYN
jgi:type I restriction enzyme S subunit